MKQIIDHDFLNRNTVTVARELIGKYVVREINGVITALQITETEAYDGPHDLACHARVGRTLRTEIMYAPAGYWYVYLIYGMHWMLNVVVGPKDYPAAVLIRGIASINGPARITKFLSINKELNALPISPASGLWLEDRGINIPDVQIISTPRIGIAYAGPEWSAKLYRFILK